LTIALIELAVAPDANRHVTAFRDLYFPASRFAPVNRSDVRAHMKGHRQPSVDHQELPDLHITGWLT
jgi:hypothetical protein